MWINNGKSEKEWIDLLQQKDEVAFTVIYNYYWDKLYLLAYARLKDTSASEEIVQEVFFQLWRNCSNLDIQNLSAYLSTMVRYNVYRYISNEVVKREREQKWSQISNHLSSFTHDFDHRFLLEMIGEVANELPEKCRLVFKYNKLEDRSIKEVATILNISPKTVEAHLTKALQFIRLKMSNIISVLVMIFTNI